MPSRQLPGELGELVQATAGKWITHPPTHHCRYAFEGHLRAVTSTDATQNTSLGQD